MMRGVNQASVKRKKKRHHYIITATFMPCSVIRVFPARGSGCVPSLKFLALVLLHF